MRVGDPCLLHSFTALGVSHEGQQMLLEDVLGFPVKAAVVLARLLEVVLLLDSLLHAGTCHRLLRPAVVAFGFAGSIVIKLVLLRGLVVDLHQGSSWTSQHSCPQSALSQHTKASQSHSTCADNKYR